MEPFSLLIQTNSPGEMSSWLSPIVRRFKATCPDAFITVFLTPCQYASGKEAAFAETLSGVDKVYTPKDTLRHLKSRPWKRPKTTNGAVLFLGGDPMYSHLLGLKYGFPVYGYTEHKKLPKRFFKHLFYKHLDGDLMADRISAYIPDPTPDDTPYCLFFPGSRPQHFRLLYPFFNEIYHKIKATHPDFEAIFQISPFISDRLFDEIIADSPPVQIQRAHSLTLLNEARLLVTIPGTNTAEAMYMRTPMLVVIPLNYPKALIFDGVVSLLMKLPLADKVIFLLNKLIKEKPLFAHPNRLTGQKRVPELIDVLSPDTVAKAISDIYYNDADLNKIKSALADIPLPPSVSQKITQKILSDSKITPH